MIKELKDNVKVSIGLLVIGFCLLMLLGVSGVTFTLNYSSAGNAQASGDDDTIYGASAAKSGDVYAIVPDNTCDEFSQADAQFEHYSDTHSPGTTGYYDVEYKYGIGSDIGKEAGGDEAYVRVLCIIERQTGGGWDYVDAEHHVWESDASGSKSIPFDDVWIHNAYTYRVRVVNIAHAYIGAYDNYAKGDAGYGSPSYEVEYQKAEFTYDHG